jgi:predicted RNA methylase
MNTKKSGSSTKQVFCAFMLALCLAGIGAGTVEAVEGRPPALKASKPSCSKVCGRIKVTQEDGKTVQCGDAAQGGAGCLCKCGDTVISTPQK